MTAMSMMAKRRMDKNRSHSLRSVSEWVENFNEHDMWSCFFVLVGSHAFRIFLKVHENPGSGDTSHQKNVKSEISYFIHIHRTHPLPPFN